MSGVIVFAAGGNSLTLRPPQWGYAVTIMLPIKRTKLGQGQGYAQYDPGVGYDVRSCKARWLLPAGDQLDLVAFFTAASDGRGQDVTLTTAAGFFPAGPDQGDIGDFTVRLLNLSQKGIGRAPFKYFETELTLAILACPGYLLPPQIEQGGTVILGTVAGLRFPPDWFKPVAVYGINNAVKRSGAVDIVDGGEHADAFETEFSVMVNQSKAAALIDYLTQKARANAVPLTTGNDAYAFGIDNGASGTYSCLMLNPELVITQEGFNRFSIDLRLWVDRNFSIIPPSEAIQETWNDTDPQWQDTWTDTNAQVQEVY